jgi:chaperonin GroEL (HSP60 family)
MMKKINSGAMIMKKILLTLGAMLLATVAFGTHTVHADDTWTPVATLARA